MRTKNLIFAAMAVVFAFPALAQSSPGFVGLTAGGVKYIPTSAQWDSYFSSKRDAASDTFVNVRDSAAKGDGVTDDTAAFASAIGIVNSRAALGVASCLYLPPGQYYINGSTLPSFSQNTGGGVCGAGSWRSVIRLGLSYSGDLFSWSDAWGAGVFNTGGTSIILPQKYGPRVVGLTILGDNAASAQQNAIMLYDHNDFVFVSDVDVENLHGRAIYAGAVKNDTVAYIRESHFDHIRVFNSGAPGIPAVEFTSQCLSSCSTQDASNEVVVGNLDIYGSRDAGLVVNNENPSGGGVVRAFHLSKIRVEGTEGNTHSATADLIRIGNASMASPIFTVSCQDCELTSPYTNYAALRITGSSLAASPYLVSFQGTISAGGGGGYGLKIDAGRDLVFDFMYLSSVQNNITIASSTTTASPIIIDAHGNERSWTWNVDATALQYVSNRNSTFGVPTANSTTSFMSAQMPDGTVNFGNARGANSVDWQTQRFAGTQAATGQSSTISGGKNNSAGGLSATVGGGLTNAAGGWLSTISGGTGNIGFGSMSAIPGGWGAFAYDYGMMAYASGNFSVAGDAQIGWSILRAATSSTTATRLTADGSGNPALGNYNSLNISTDMSWLFDLDCVYRNTTNGATATWTFNRVLMTQGASASTTAVSSSAATAGPTSGSPGATAPTVAADTTNGSLALTFTAPNANASHIACGVTKLVIVK